MAAVLYLNTGGGAEFVGGLLQFKDDEPSAVLPAAGTLVSSHDHPSKLDQHSSCTSSLNARVLATPLYGI